MTIWTDWLLMVTRPSPDIVKTASVMIVSLILVFWVFRWVSLSPPEDLVTPTSSWLSLLFPLSNLIHVQHIRDPCEADIFHHRTGSCWRPFWTLQRWLLWVNVRGMPHKMGPVNETRLVLTMPRNWQLKLPSPPDAPKGQCYPCLYLMLLPLERAGVFAGQKVMTFRQTWINLLWRWAKKPKE